MELFEFIVGRMNMLVTSQYQPRVSSLTNFARGGSANQIAVFTSNKIILLCSHSFLLNSNCHDEHIIYV